MVRTTHVGDLAAAALAPYRTLRRPEAHAAAGIFVAEGPTVIERLLATPLAVESMLCTAEWLEHFRPALERRGGAVEVFLTTEAVLREMVGFHLFNGVLAVAQVPASPPLGSLLAARPRPARWVAIDGVTSADNLGTLIRSAVALGAEAILCGETTASPWLRRAVRTSMGAVLARPVLVSRDLAADLAALAAAGCTVRAAEAAGGEPLDRVRWPGEVCVVFGSEGAGLRPAVRAACGDAVTIPMHAGFDSLNVAAAAAIVLYDWSRRAAAGG